ncbi:hypothetical protein RDWZM_007605 [Blomia tropicalis]|uniref:Uncharacterized protein n=1 Tax=Blomia tropicalis TaxID=40697 RepID=A0A9Q0M0I7_BLOTA|nr:hypothetical protein RDWZM_007605 [Blomia tropicalis]
MLPPLPMPLVTYQLVTDDANAVTGALSATSSNILGGNSDVNLENAHAHEISSKHTTRRLPICYSTDCQQINSGKCEKDSFTEEDNLSQEDTGHDDSYESSSLSEKENDGRNINTPKIVRSYSVKIQRKSSLRGILKYPRQRAISESSALDPNGNSQSDDSFYFGTSFEEEEEDNECIDDKPKKNVTFSEKMSTTFVFRPNSSILGRRLKNQKKSKKKKEKRLRDSLENIASDDECIIKSLDDIEATKQFIDMQRYPLVDDSASELSSSSGCDCSASECSGDEALVTETLNCYQDESKSSQDNKTKRKNRRNRNRKNKQNVRTRLETGGYDSD